MSVEFNNPPISEMVIGVYLREPLPKLKSQHVGLFWNQIWAEFPEATQSPPIGDVDFESADEIFPLPRFWFYSKDENFILQLQRNALLLNWKRAEEIPYPSFSKMKDLFFEKLESFESFCSKKNLAEVLSYKTIELNYINIIDNTEYFQTFSDTKRIIPSFAHPKIDTFSSEARHFNVKYEYLTRKNVPLAVSIQSRRNQITKNDALYFEIRSICDLPQNSRSDADTWFVNAHDAIINAFVNLTSPDIQEKYWQRRNS